MKLKPWHPRALRDFTGFILLALFWLNGDAAPLKGRVIGVLDGDTISLIDHDHRSLRIRLAQIDAPEKHQPFGAASKQSLSSLVFGKDVLIDIVDKDRYGRSVAKIHIDEMDVNLEQVRRGMAWVYEKYARESRYFNVQLEAKKERRGLWKDQDPTPPWTYRHNTKKSHP